MTPQPGPVGEEAARLVEALSKWIGSKWIGSQSAGSQWAGPHVDGAGEVPLATGSAECRVCPVCQLLAVVRQTRPEVFGHLADASSSFAAALRTAVETAHHEHAGTGRGGVERIDLDEEPAADTWGAAR